MVMQIATFHTGFLKQISKMNETKQINKNSRIKIKKHAEINEKKKISSGDAGKRRIVRLLSGARKEQKKKTKELWRANERNSKDLHLLLLQSAV